MELQMITVNHLVYAHHIKSEINNFATEINKLMLNQSKLISLGEKGRDKVNSYFSKEVVVEKFQTLYKSIIKV